MLVVDYSRQPAYPPIEGRLHFPWELLINVREARTVPWSLGSLVVLEVNTVAAGNNTTT
jgi:hypothetical protein